MVTICSGHSMGTVVVPVRRPTGPLEADTIMPIFHFCTAVSPSLGPRWGAGLRLSSARAAESQSQQQESSDRQSDAHLPILESRNGLPILYFTVFVR